MPRSGPIAGRDLLNLLPQRPIGKSRQEPLHPLQLLGEHLEEAEITHQSLQAGALIKTQRRHRSFKTIRMRHQFAEDEILHEVQPLPFLALAGEFRHQFAGIDAAGAGGSAGLAVETEGEEFEEALRLVKFAFLHFADQRHPPAR